MYNILIVDDERIERSGIKLLIRKNNLALNVAEAENGEKALEHLKSNNVDILFTDIKMPFMDGLELAEKARELNAHLKIIIFSAYGEFDYARKAINLSVVHYILKPVDTDEFVRVLSNVIEICRQEEEEREKNKKVQEIYNIGFEYEKEKILFDLVNGASINKEFERRLELIGSNLPNKYIQMILLDFKRKFYDTNGDGFKGMLKNIISHEYEYLNLNEQQSVIFMLDDVNSFNKNDLDQLDELIKNAVKQEYGMVVNLAYANVIRKIEDISSEFDRLESILDNKYFLEGSISGNDDSNKKVIKDIATIIEDNYMKDLSLEWIAEKVYLTPSYLSSMFKKETGKSLIKYITSFRMEKARELLHNTNMRITDISEKIGYANTSYFILNFKSHFGISPAKYREKEE